MPDDTSLIIPRIPRGFSDYFADDACARQQMIDKVLSVYTKYGFELLETPAIEYVDALGRYLPESDTPSGGIFSLRDDDEQWVALRYDLTAPACRVVAQYGHSLPSPYRRCQYGPVWRMEEKTGPTRFRQFYQLDFDSIGASSIVADAEVCMVLKEAFEALGIDSNDFIIRVNNRKVLNAVLENIGVSVENETSDSSIVLRTMDKLDKIGFEGIISLLGEGRFQYYDEDGKGSGDFTAGAKLSSEQISSVVDFLKSGETDRLKVCESMMRQVGNSETGREGVEELMAIHELLEVSGLSSDVVQFDPSVVRGIGYYTGPVFEVSLTFEVEDESGKLQQFGSVAGGGRYDGLVKRFTGIETPATGASIGVDRLLSALKSLGKISSARTSKPVVVAVLDKSYLNDYQLMVNEMRAVGIAAELYLGNRGLNAQNKYADKHGSPILVIAGGDEFSRGEVAVKDMVLGSKLSKVIKDRDEWRTGRPAQVTVPRDQLVSTVKEILARNSN